MADNEKLDNQRLKNFKNKGRDLEGRCYYFAVQLVERGNSCGLQHRASQLFGGWVATCVI